MRTTLGIPAAAMAAAALALVATASPVLGGERRAVHPTQQRQASAGDTVDLSWLPAHDASGAPFDLSALESRRVVLVRTSTWCVPCGSDGALRPVVDAATAHTDVQFVALLVLQTPAEARAQQALVSAPNVHVFAVDDQLGATALPDAFTTGVPTVASLDASHRARVVANGRDRVLDALAGL